MPEAAVAVLRIDKHGLGHRLRGIRQPSPGGSAMRVAGIDIASETHVVAVLDHLTEQVLVKSTEFEEDLAGYDKLFTLLGSPIETSVAMEATGHYWKNLFAVLSAKGYLVFLLNPLRTHRFGQEDLERTKTDAIDAVNIARFVIQKKCKPTRLPDAATEELRELVHMMDRFIQDLGDRVRQLHRLVDLGFPEFTRHVRTLDSELATAILQACPTAQAFRGMPPRRLAKLCYDGRHRVGDDLAGRLITAAALSVGQHHGEVYRIEIRYLCEDIDTLRKRVKQIRKDLEGKVDAHEVGKLLNTIDGLGPTTVARILAVVGDPAQFGNAKKLASFLGVIPGLALSGKSKNRRAGLTPFGHAALRRALWMPTLTAVRKNPWLRAFYESLRARGKLPKVALVAAMRKLLSAIYSVAKNRQPFVPHMPTPAT
jgi:transposase